MEAPTPHAPPASGAHPWIPQGSSLGAGSGQCRHQLLPQTLAMFFPKKINFLGFFHSVCPRARMRKVSYELWRAQWRGKENPGSLRKGSAAAPWMGGDEPGEVGIPPKPAPDLGKGTWGSLAGGGSSHIPKSNPNPASSSGALRGQ